jgi:hypothetical protein
LVVAGIAVDAGGVPPAGAVDLPAGGPGLRVGAREQEVLSFTRYEWVSFLDGLGKGEFDHLS